MALMVGPLLLGFVLIMIGIIAAAILAETGADDFPPAQADTEAPDGPDLR